MKKISIVIVGLNILSISAISIFIIFSQLQFDIYSETPFKMSNNYLEIHVSRTSTPLSLEKRQTILKEILNKIENENIVIIVQDIDAMGLALYDPQGYYDIYPLKEGGDNIYGVLNGSTSSILAKENSFVHNYAMNNNYYFDIHKEKYVVRGVYDSSHPLYTAHTQYVYDFAKHFDIRGTYYIDTSSPNLVNEIIELLNKSGYSTNISNKTSGNGFLDIMNRILINNSIYRTSLIGVAFIYINFMFFYQMYFRKYKKLANIHYIFGAKKSSLFSLFSKHILLSITIGSSLGSSAYAYFCNRINANFSIEFMLLSIIANIFLSYISFCVSIPLSKILVFKSEDRL